MGDEAQERIECYERSLDLEEWIGSVRHEPLRSTGKNLDGVPMLQGNLEIPTRASILDNLRRIGMGSCLLFLFLCLLTPNLKYVLAPPVLVLVSLLLYFVIQTISDCLYRSRYSSIVSLRELAERAGQQELSLLVTLKQAGVKPKCMINGLEYFDYKDLGDAAILLRPANAPEDYTSNLVRPASHSVTPAEHLPRSVDTDDR